MMFTAQHAHATACDYSGTITFGDQVIDSHECWDLSSWPADKATQFCSMMGMGDDDEDDDAAIQIHSFKGTQLPTCPSDTVARCEGAQFASEGGSYADLPDDYYEQFPPEMRAEIRANAEAASRDMDEAFAPFKGLKATVHYYKDTSGFIKPADLKNDCEQGKRGVFEQ